MRKATPVAKTNPLIKQFLCLRHLAVFLFSSVVFTKSHGQAVTEIITDYNGFWRSSAASLNTLKPDKAHNLLAFTYNSIRYSTGANDSKLTSQNLGFTQADFWSLPVAGMTGTIGANTKLGLGALQDGVANGSGNTAPESEISNYLTDGIKGLGIGTCIANLPIGSMSFSINNIQSAAIGDGIPDILVTQVADPSGSSFDRYEFTNSNGARVGTYKDIVFTNIAPVGTWTADFYEAATNSPTLQAGFTQTDRPIRLWAADISELGITTSNYQQVRNFKINLCGNSDVAFVAYNNKSIGFATVLPTQYEFFKATVKDKSVLLSWKTFSEQGATRFVIERSKDGLNFSEIGRLNAAGTSNTGQYSFVDRNPLAGANYYRLREVDTKGDGHFSRTVTVTNLSSFPVIRLYPIPVRNSLQIHYPSAFGGENLLIFDMSGQVVLQQTVSAGSTRVNLDVSRLHPGVYFVGFGNKAGQAMSSFVIR